MSKILIEWKDGAAWRQVQAEILHTRNGNCAVKHDGGIMVFPSLKEGSEVVALADGKWVRAGRVTRAGLIFLGEGLSYSEAKSHVRELISTLRAKNDASVERIRESLDETRRFLGSKTEFDWTKTFHQYANRLLTYTC